MKTPIANNATILIIFLIDSCLLVEFSDRGMAIPMMKMKDGKMKSAGVTPSH